MTNKKLSIIQLTWPIFIEILLQMMVGNVDQFMLSHYSQESVAAVGNANQVINIVIIGLSVISMASTILIAQYRGADNRDKMAEVCTVSLGTNGLIGLVISLVLYYGDAWFLELLGVPFALWSDASLFLRSIGSLLWIQALYISFISFFRGCSMVKITMLCSVVINICNILGNCLLIHGWGPIPSLGVWGVTLSTNGSKILGLLLIAYLFRKYIALPLSWRYWVPFPKKMIYRILYLGLPSGGESLSYQISQLVIMKFVNVFGLVVITTKVYAYIIAMFCYVYTQALAMATQIMVGYLMGAGDYDSVNKRVWKTIRMAVLISTTVTVLLYLNSDAVYGLFTDNPEVKALGRHIFLIEIFLEMGRAVNIVMVMSLQAAGDIKGPVTIGLVSMWTVATGGAYLLGLEWEWGLIGIWLAMMADECLRAVIFLYRWKTGVWKKKSIMA